MALDPIISIVVSLVLFSIMIIIFSDESKDYVLYTIFAALVACVLASFTYGLDFQDFQGFIELEPLIFIVCMQVIIQIVDEQNIFQYLVLRLLHFTKGNHILFFFLICLLATFSSSIVSDIIIVMIFVPIVIRACRILKINPAAYLFGLSFTINLGSILTPVSSSANILIATTYRLSFIYFLQSFIVISIVLIILTLILVFLKWLKGSQPPSDYDRIVLLEIMEPNLVIVDHNQFKRTALLFSIIMGLFIFISDSFIVAVSGAIVIVAVSKKDFTEIVRKTDLKLILFFIGIFLLMGTMQINGIFSFLGNFSRKLLTSNIILDSIIILIIISIISGFLVQVPATLVFINLLNDIYADQGIPNLIIISFVIGLNIGSNFLPQGAMSDLMTLNIAQKNDVKDFNYKSLLKWGSLMTIVHIIASIFMIILIALLLPNYATSTIAIP